MGKHIVKLHPRQKQKERLILTKKVEPIGGCLLSPIPPIHQTGSSDEDGGRKKEERRRVGNEDEKSSNRKRSLSPFPVFRLKNHMIFPGAKGEEKEEELSEKRQLSKEMAETVSLAAAQTLDGLGKIMQSIDPRGLRKRRGIDNNVKHQKIRLTDKEDMPSALTEDDAGWVVENNPVEEKDEAATVVYVNPLVSFLTADSTLFLVACIAISTAITFKHMKDLKREDVPLQVILAWLLLAYAFGNVVTINDIKTVVSRIISNHKVEIPLEFAEHQERRRHSLMLSFMSDSSNQMSFVPENKVKTAPKVWTTLDKECGRELFPWELNADPTKDKMKSVLQQRFSCDPDFIRHREGSSAEAPVAVHNDAADVEGVDIQPIMKLRGFDVFTADEPQSDAGEHPWLLRNGLREVPTFLINVVMHWGNIILYFQFPDWVTSLSNLTINESDSEEVVALKKFLNGDDQVKGERMKIAPVLLKGPLPIRMLAPQTKETMLACSTLPMTWRSHEANVDLVDGKRRAPLLEAELDCVQNRSLRAMAGLFKRALTSVVLDLGIVLSKPEDQKEEEPQACLGMCRFHEIDPSKCCYFPDPVEDAAVSLRCSVDVLRASKVIGLHNLSDDLRAEG